MTRIRRWNFLPLWVPLLCLTLSCRPTDDAKTAADDGQVSAVRAFVAETFALELSGVRWRELTDPSTARSFYARYAWKSEVEPGWDTVYIVDAVQIESVLHDANCRWDALRDDSEVESRTGACWQVTVRGTGARALGRDAVTLHADLIIKHTVVDIGGKWVVADRLHAPLFGTEAAAALLESSPYAGSPALDELRRDLRRAGSR